MSNDTSFGSGFAPLSETEQLVLDVDRFLVEALPRKVPGLGKDTKIDGLRERRHISLTVECMFVGSEIADHPTYLVRRAQAEEELRRFATARVGQEVDVTLNPPGPDEGDHAYLTVHGLSVGNGRCGSTGRGNRCNGLVTPYRTMSIEAVCGKNAVTHPGRINRLHATKIESEIVARTGGDVTEAHVKMLSVIGTPIDRPAVTSVRLRTAPGSSFPRSRREACQIVEEWLGRTRTLPQLLREGKIRTF